MRLPRPSPGKTPEESQQEFGTYLGRLIGTYSGFSTPGAFCREHGFGNLSHNISGKKDTDRDHFAAILAALNLDAKAMEAAWKIYAGKPGLSMQEHVQAGVRRYGHVELLKMLAQTADSNNLSHVGGSILTYMQYGNPHRDKEVDAPHHPPLSTWSTIATTLGLTRHKLYKVWSTDTRQHLQQDRGLNEFGTEMELLFREDDTASRTQWRRRTDRPEPIRNMKSRTLEPLVEKVRKGELAPWRHVEKLCAALKADISRTLTVADAWWKELNDQDELTMERFGDTDTQWRLVAIAEQHAAHYAEAKGFEDYAQHTAAIRTAIRDAFADVRPKSMRAAAEKMIRALAKESAPSE